MKTRELIIVIMLGMAPALSFAASTWSAAPEPTGTADSTPLKVTLNQDITFTAADLEDLDTLTNVQPTDSCISVTQTLVPDNVGGSWTIYFPWAPRSAVLNQLVARVTTQAWDWSPGDEDDTGAVEHVSGAFMFDDGRGNASPPDARHDTTGLLIGGGSAYLLIPDDMTTTLEGCVIPEPNHYGTLFRMFVKNEAHPDFVFDGLWVKEEIAHIQCAIHNQAVDTAIDGLIAEAVDSWPIDGANSFIDSHVAGPKMGTIFEQGNTSATLWQYFHITTSGWRAKNPNHSIGATGGVLGRLSALHLVTYTLETPNPPPAFWRVRKDGVTCAHTP